MVVRLNRLLAWDYTKKSLGIRLLSYMIPGATLSFVERLALSGATVYHARILMCHISVTEYHSTPGSSGVTIRLAVTYALEVTDETG